MENLSIKADYVAQLVSAAYANMRNSHVSYTGNDGFMIACLIFAEVHQEYCRNVRMVLPDDNEFLNLTSIAAKEIVKIVSKEKTPEESQKIAEEIQEVILRGDWS
jgi:hypothetical protein